MTRVARTHAGDGLVAALAKAALSLAVLAMGFTHVSDDDYSRTVIAQLFAHAPRLDPSGTSWLPFPFWITGGAMMLAGRSLGAARAIAIALSSLAAVAPYLGARSLGVARGAALAGALLAACTPVCAWLGAATVPEGFSGLLAAGAIFGLGGAPWTAAFGLLCASLSRYEAWPACAVAAIALASRRRWGPALVAALGPLAWMAWNQLAHGDALHFFARVSRFHAAHAAPAPFAERLLENPRALVLAFPEVLPLALVVLFALRAPAYRARWSLPAAAALATLAFLIIGDLRGGAPTHHAERALVPVFATFAMAGADALASRRALAIALGAGWTALSLARAPHFPGASPAEDRSPQIAQGESLRGAPALTVTPCAYEHFALLAAFEAPERATLRSAAQSAGPCPRIEAR